jgi:hypothetical protein
MAQRMMDPSYMDVGNDPTLRAGIDASAGPLMRAREQALNRVRAIAAGSGASLSDRTPFAESSATAQIDEQMKEQAAQIMLNELQSRREASLQAPRIMGQGYVLQENPGRIQTEVGDYRRALDFETRVQPAQMAFQEQVNAASRPLGPYQNFFGTTGPAPPNTPNTRGNEIVQGTLGGAALGGQIGGAWGGNGGPWGTAAGAILGGIASSL